MNNRSPTRVLPTRALCVSLPDPVPAGSAPSPPWRPVPPSPGPAHKPCSPGCPRPTSAGHKRWTRWTSPWWGRRLPRNGLPRVYLPDRREEVGPQIDSCLLQLHHVDTWLTSLLAISVVSKTLRFFGSYGCAGKSFTWNGQPTVTATSQPRLLSLLVWLLCRLAWLQPPPSSRTSSAFSAGLRISMPATATWR